MPRKLALVLDFVRREEHASECPSKGSPLFLRKRFTQFNHYFFCCITSCSIFFHLATPRGSTVAEYILITLLLVFVFMCFLTMKGGNVNPAYQYLLINMYLTSSCAVLLIEVYRESNGTQSLSRRSWFWCTRLYLLLAELLTLSVSFPNFFISKNGDSKILLLLLQ